jgi:hypothetical protein
VLVAFDHSFLHHEDDFKASTMVVIIVSSSVGGLHIGVVCLMCCPRLLVSISKSAYFLIQYVH